MTKLPAILSALIVTVLPALAQAKDPAPANTPTYVELSPSFVTNFQAPRIRFIKADIALKVEDASTVDAVHRHTPYIRNNLVMLFNRQSEGSLQSPEGRQYLKEQALQEVISALQAENEPTNVKEVLFTSFIVD